jgi:light-regulated signal transduction histidine kinase (bacteriophytochrome)
VEISPGLDFKSRFSDGQQQLIDAFFQEIRDRGAAYDVRIPLEDQGQASTLHLSGALTPEYSIILFCSRSDAAMDERMFSELIQINNEQVNRLREFARKEARADARNLENEDELYNRLTRLNNELITTQRELAKKNQKLEREIRERTRAEQELAKKNDELRSANKELEAFSYAVSHDLKAPLRHISGFAEVLSVSHENELDDEGRYLVGEIRAAARRMTAIVRSLLKLSRVQRAEIVKSEVDLSTVAGEILTEIQRQNPEREVETNIEEGVVAECDKYLIRIVLDNLLRNAWKYTAGVESPRIEFGVEDENGQRIFYVKDNGVGFDPEQAEAVFEPFTRLHSEEEFEGLGIGLSTVRKIIHRHDGTIWAESPGRSGATFFFTL